MEGHEVDNGCWSLMNSLKSLGWGSSRTAIAESFVGQETEHVEWTCPLACSLEAGLLPLGQQGSAMGNAHACINPLTHPSAGSDFTACLLSDGPGGHNPSLQQLGTIAALSERPSTGESEFTGLGPDPLQLPMTLVTGPSPATSTEEATCDAANMQIGSAAQPDWAFKARVISPACSLRSQTCLASPDNTSGSLAAQQRPSRRACSADSADSCTSLALQPEEVLMPDEPPDECCQPKLDRPHGAATTQNCADAAVATRSTVAEPVCPDALRISDAMPTEVICREGAAPVSTSRHTNQPSAAAARGKDAALTPQAAHTHAAQATNLERAARQQTAMCRAGTESPVGPSSAKVQRLRQQQKEYNERKKVKEAALCTSVDHLKAEISALQGSVGTLLSRHEELTRDLPWCQQHDEIQFAVSLAGLMTPPAGTCKETDRPLSPDLLQSLMLEPAAVVDKLLTSSGPKTADLQGCVSPMHKLPKIPGATPDVPWASILASLRLSNDQKGDIAALYRGHLHKMAFVDRDCVAIASHLQRLPRPVGELTERMWPNMAGLVLSSQLCGVARWQKVLIADLTISCKKVLSPLQRLSMQRLLPDADSALWALCQEVLAKCSRPRRGSLTSAKKARTAVVTRAHPAATSAATSQEASCCKAQAGTDRAADVAHAAGLAQEPGMTPAANPAHMPGLAPMPVMEPDRSQVAAVATVMQGATSAAAQGNAPALRPAVTAQDSASASAAAADLCNFAHLAASMQAPAAETETPAQPTQFTAVQKRSSKRCPTVAKKAPLKKRVRSGNTPHLSEHTHIAIVPAVANFCQANMRYALSNKFPTASRAAAEDDEYVASIPLHNGCRMKARNIRSVQELHTGNV